MESLRGMVSVVQVARSGSFVRAAEALGVSAVAVSRNVALRSGDLQVLHPDLSPGGLQLFLHDPDRQLPARVRVFVNFVLAQGRHHADLALTARDAAALAPVSPATMPAPATPRRRRSGGR